MSKPLSEKLNLYIINMASSYLPFGGSKWDSSAKMLSDELDRCGVKLSKKIFYKYQLPDNMSSQQFQDRITIEYFCKRFYSDFASKVFRDKTLTISEKMQIARYVWEMRRKKNHHDMKYYADEIKSKNPELADIKLANNIVNLVYGALFGFAPDEIKYFCEVSGARDFRKEHELDEELEHLGIYTNYVLAPDTAKAIMAALQQQKD